LGPRTTAQIRAVYGQDQAKSWFGMTGTKIITRINASEAAEDISRLIGEQGLHKRVLRLLKSACPDREKAAAGASA
jgi:type IV secretory pathway TraG/TraD family ATPase VirD4